ncbi:MAG: tetratricopeptide repeat protein [Spirulinaceae cyanobacterium]
MLTKIWQWLKKLFRSLFPQQVATPATEKPTPQFSDADYEQFFFALLDGVVDEGWSQGSVKGFFFAKKLTVAELALWLRRFGERLQEAEVEQKELRKRLVRFGEAGRRIAFLRELVEVVGEIVGDGEEVAITELNSSATEETSVISEVEYDSQAVELLNQGVEKYQAGDYPAAIQLWTQAIEIKPDDYQAYYNRGVTLRELGRNEEAIADHTKAIFPTATYICCLSMLYSRQAILFLIFLALNRD